mmetsp:Transcript_27484/g.44723  ORF Transcript_27484/g.44723 Transcript_27484/m.44723 type:complete len:337 (+) Transcript_27484:764-1774(+)
MHGETHSLILFVCESHPLVVPPHRRGGGSNRATTTTTSSSSSSSIYNGQGAEEEEEEEESYLENEHGNSLSIRPITSVGEKSSKKSFLMKNPSYLSGGASQNEGGEMMRSIPDDVKRSCSQSTLMRDDTEYPSAKPCALITMRALGIKEFPAPILLLGNLLEEIDLSRNNIKVLPPSISSLRKLKKLNLAYNKIEVLPNNFEELQHLEVLNVDVNKMSIFPPQICALSNLKILSFRFNTIKRIPKELNRLSNVIEHVKLEGNSPSLMANLLSTCPALGSALTEKSLFSKNYRFSASALPKMLDEALGDKLDDEGVVVLRLGDDGDDSKPPQKNGRH